MISAAVIVHYTTIYRIPIESTKPGGTQAYDFPIAFMAIIFANMICYSIFQHLMFVCQMAFHARVSDASIGGTYMTLLNTVANLGMVDIDRYLELSLLLLLTSSLSLAASSLPASVMLYFVDPLTWRYCGESKIDLVKTAIRNQTHSIITDDMVEEWLVKNATCKTTGIEVRFFLSMLMMYRHGVLKLS